MAAIHLGRIPAGMDRRLVLTAIRQLAAVVVRTRKPVTRADREAVAGQLVARARRVEPGRVDRGIMVGRRERPGLGIRLVAAVAAGRLVQTSL